MKIKRTKATTILSVAVVLLVILMAIFPSIFATYDPLQMDMANSLQGPSAAHWLGTDEFGRDLWSRIVYGARPSIAVGIGSATLAALIGIPLGLAAGYFGKICDNVIMRIMDACAAFPSFLLAILIITIMDPSTTSLIVTISVVNIPAFARIVRSNVLSLKKREFVEATKAFGAKGEYIMFRTILPNCISSITVEYSLIAATAILMEAGMSFLGLGIQPPTPSWGSMLSYANQYLNQSLTYMFVPTCTIFLVVLCVNLLGDALRDWFDPTKMK